MEENEMFGPSKLANKYLAGLKGIEIGGSYHNQFFLDTINVDFTDSCDTVFKESEIEISHKTLHVDVVSNVVEFQDVDDKVGNGFTIIIKK
jgi:hypothetical protein